MRNIFLVIGVFSVFNVNAQFVSKQSLAKRINQQSNQEWLYFENIDPISGRYFAQRPTEFIEISADNKFQLSKISTDEMGSTHTRYSHYYKGYRVMYSELLTHEKNGQLSMINGHVPTRLNKNLSVQFSERNSFEKALQTFGKAKFDWEIIPGVPNLFYKKPEAELVWVQPTRTDVYDANSYVLAYKYDISSYAPMNAKTIFVNAVTGAIVREVQLMADCEAATVQTSFNGSRVISTEKLSATSFRLNNDCNTKLIETVNWPYNKYLLSTNNTWTHDTMRAAATTLWGLEIAYNYFKSIHNYLSWDGGGGGLRAYINYNFCDNDGNNCYKNNASFYRGVMCVGYGDTESLLDDWNTLDIAGHEFTHGISDTMAHLIYENESGALNESFSDIFGNVIQANQLGTIPNVWKVGEDRKDASGNSLWIRDMENPKNRNSFSGSGQQPDTYKKQYWYTGTWDNGGVHVNSGVQNKMFYLLANGGTGTNDLLWSYDVKSIGIIPARRIAFKALVDYMDGNATYSTARAAWLAAAANLFGTSSNEYRQVANAWYAVGVCANTGTENIFECGNKVFSTNQTFAGFTDIYLGFGCTYTLSNTTGFIKYIGGNSVILFPGFTAYSGSNVSFTITPCDP